MCLLWATVFLYVSSAHLSWGDVSTINRSLASSRCSKEADSSHLEWLNCSTSEDSCSNGLFCHDGLCRCMNYDKLPNKLVSCEGKGSTPYLLVRDKYCVTFDEHKKEVLVGNCVYSDVNISVRPLYYPVCLDRLNEICININKVGALCGSCHPGYYPLAFSFNLRCVLCPHPHWNWLRYSLAAYLPLTIFFFIVVFFKVKTMSGHMHAAICVCQAFSFPAMVRFTTGYFENMTDFKVILIKIGLSLYGIWNLDFFRPFYTKLCLDVDVLQILALDYAVAMYPLFLMVVSYLLIALYDKNYRVVTALWSPFRRLFSLFRRNWDIKTTLTDAFATFFFLSNIKFLSVSFDLLAPTTVYHLHRDNVTETLGLYYSANIEYFGEKHLPYAVLAIVVVCLCVVFPAALLAVYPLTLFQKFLNLFPLRWHILHTFMDSFHGSYRNGTEPGTRDCRSFLAVFFILRILLFIVYACLKNVMTFAVAGLVLIIVCATLIAVKPYKSPPSHSNVACVVYFLLLTFVFFSLAAVNSPLVVPQLWNVLVVFGILAYFIPLADVVRVCVMFAVRRRRCVLWRVKYYSRRTLSNEYEELLGGSGSEEEENLSDRIMNPKAYPKGNLSSFAALQRKTG